jgi:hypothetical protein
MTAGSIFNFGKSANKHVHINVLVGEKWKIKKLKTKLLKKNHYEEEKISNFPVFILGKKNTILQDW